MKAFKCKISETCKLGKSLKVFNDRLYRKYPVVIIITGEVGTGKSRSILLNLLDHWNKFFFGKLPPEKNLTADLTKYAGALRKAKPMDLIVLDEAIDAFGKGASETRITNAFTNMFGICRERQVATAIVLDDIFILKTKLAKYVNLWIHCDKRIDNKCSACGKEFAGFKTCPYCNSKKYLQGVVRFRVYSKQRLRKILRENENRTIKSLNINSIPPNFRSAVREYSGNLEEYYNQLKKDKTEETMNDLIKTMRIKKRELKKVEDEYIESSKPKTNKEK